MGDDTFQAEDLEVELQIADETIGDDIFQAEDMSFTPL
jgi:hypothetical protein